MIFNAFIISLKMSVSSIVASSIVGILLANLLYRSKIKLKGVIENIILLPMFLPPSIIGYGLLILLSRNSFLGKYLYSLFNIKLIFTWQAGAIATFVMALPIIYQNSKSAFLSVDKECEEAGKIDGANSIQIFFKIKLPMSIRGILCGIILGFARAFGEFGATIMVAGNIPGRTENIPLAIYYAVDNGDTKVANELFILVIILSLVLISVFNYLITRSDY
jgi:molybdate transport system permease protein